MVTRSVALQEVRESTGALITVCGQYVPPLHPDSIHKCGTKLFLWIEGSTELMAECAKIKLKRMILELQTAAASRPCRLLLSEPCY